MEYSKDSLYMKTIISVAGILLIGYFIIKTSENAERKAYWNGFFDAYDSIMKNPHAKAGCQRPVMMEGKLVNLSWCNESAYWGACRQAAFRRLHPNMCTYIKDTIKDYSDKEYAELRDSAISSYLNTVINDTAGVK
jgi:hypothetical protein